MTFSSPSKDVFDLVQYSEDLPEEFLCNVWYGLQNSIPMDKYIFLHDAHKQYCWKLCQGIYSFITNLFCNNWPVLDAHLAALCGHTFCGFCVEQFRKTTGAIACAKCREPGVDFFCNIFANNVLSTFKGQCKSCLEKFDLDMSKDHVWKCQQIMVTCELCQATLKQGEKVAHSQACPLSDTTWECREKIKKKDEHDHRETTCGMTPIPCPLKCGVFVKR